LDEAARGGFALAALAVGPGAATPGRGAPEGAADPTDRGPADPQPVLLAELLGEVGVIEAHVAGGHQGDDLGAHRVGEPLGRGLAPAPVDQAGRTGRPIAGLEPLHLPHGQVQGGGGFPVGEAFVAQGFENAGARRFLPTHGEGVHEGMTFSLTR
jgi:hypothetical protein